MARILALMGSGENSPAMVTPHQNILKKSEGAKRINLDTPYGFQENANELSEKIEKYFAVNVGKEIHTVQLRDRHIRESALREIQEADWIFSGPGSPTYALRTWTETGADQVLLEHIDRGTIVMASAAAMTLGAKVMPVYEMYKVGEDPFWLDGINLLERATGIRATVIAHYNNAQGGTHDTRYCFAGARRMAILEEQLDKDISILGIDEHTGIAFDLDANTAETFGKGLITFKNGDLIKTFSPKETINISDLIPGKK